MRVLSRFVPVVLTVLLPAITLPAQEARLSNLAIRAQGGGGDTLITGFTLGPGGNKTVLIRAVGPTLGAFGVSGALDDPRLELFSGDRKVAENDNFNATDAATFAAVGAFALAPGARDAALVTSLAPGSYTAQVSGLPANGAGGVTLVEVYDVSGGTTRLVNLSTRAEVGTGANLLIPGLTIAPGAGTRRLLLRAIGPGLAAFGVSGTLADPKLELFSGTAKVAENDNWSVPVGIAADRTQLAASFDQAGAFALTAGSADAALLLNLGPGSYTLQVSGVGGTTGSALVEVYDLTPATPSLAPASALYLASLRPAAGAAASTASGYATVAISPDGWTARVSVSFSNLSTAQASAHLRLGSGADFVLALPAGRVTEAGWNFSPAGPYSTADLIAALQNGTLGIGIASTRYPAGELQGTFVRATGSRAFTAPAAPPPLDAGALTAPTVTDAARLLTQATFGVTAADVDRVRARGVSGWIDDQIALPATSLHTLLLADVAEFPNPPPPLGGAPAYTDRSNLNAAWFKLAVTAPDQLRQRVAFALSEIFVIGTMAEVDREPQGKAWYYDHLVNGAFGNFRTLLEQIALSPMMGYWLSHRANPKADPVRGTSPDENFAREIMQLFTIGLVQLQPDGTLLLDAAGQPIPTYDQNTIVETAKVFTGWALAVNPATTTSIFDFQAQVANWEVKREPGHPILSPMRHFPAFHDRTEKRVVSRQQVHPREATPTLIPANQTGAEDLRLFLDTLFNHPNTGPFLCKQLIKRLVTSNPSPAYVYRVAQVFGNDGTGTRGNVGAVVRAILTDYEARSPEVLGNVGYGKIKEPLIRLAGLFRALAFRAPNGRFLDSYFGDPRNSGSGLPSGVIFDPNGFLGQAPLYSLTVFNFFTPDFSPPGPIAAAGLVAPELQITDSLMSIAVPNALNHFLTRHVAALPAPPSGASPFLVTDFSALLPNVRNPSALADQLSLLFCANQMTPALRSLIAATLGALPPVATDLERVQTAVQLALLSPDGATQR
jgi:uncharacterized protein (DUF1800 family)